MSSSRSAGAPPENCHRLARDSSVSPAAKALAKAPCTSTVVRPHITTWSKPRSTRSPPPACRPPIRLADPSVPARRPSTFILAEVRASTSTLVKSSPRSAVAYELSYCGTGARLPISDTRWARYARASAPRRFDAYPPALLLAFLKRRTPTDPDTHRCINFVVVWRRSTGVEMAGAIAELAARR